jgi:hypothetical protein
MLTMEPGKKALDVGRSYLVGATVPRPEFQRVYTSSPNEWQRLAYEWCMANPSRMLVLTSTKSRLIYHIAKRGEYVEFGLPPLSRRREVLGQPQWQDQVADQRRLSILCASFSIVRKIIWNLKTEGLVRKTEAAPHCYSSLKRMGVHSIGPW